LDQELQPLAVAKLLAKVVEAEKPDFIVLGKQSIDSDAAQTGAFLAGLLNYPQATFASKLEIADKKALITRETDAGVETLEASLPLVLTADLRLNQPRYAALPNIMKAKKKPIDSKPIADYGVDVTPRIQTVSVAEPTARKAGITVPDVATLVDKLKNEAGVI
ncbi:hypothetical protein DYB28_012111, partial [Aphanomyces astaci]